MRIKVKNCSGEELNTDSHSKLFIGAEINTERQRCYRSRLYQDAQKIPFLF